MREDPEFPGEMGLELRLAADGGERIVRVSARTRIEASGPRDAGGRRRQLRDIVPVFVAAIDAGLFKGPREGERARVITALAALNDGERVDEWEIWTPPLDVEAFGVLARMFWTAGARAVGIVERGPEQRLGIRSLDHAPPSTVRMPPWAVERHLSDAADNASVSVCFERQLAPEMVRGTHAVLRAWGALVSFGGFTGGKGAPTSAAVLHQLGQEGGREISATFETLALGPDGWGSLWSGLARIHRQASIVRVEMH